ncbi:MAG: DUF362 domain-containing protein [Promethearchaeota archaeon]|jgi:UDP-glucose 4-epimerase
MEKKEQIETLFKKMLKDFEETSQNDKIYREDITDLGKLTIQWRLSGVVGYQILELDNYSYKFGERLEDPDITFIWRDPDETIKFLEGKNFRQFRTLKQYTYGANDEDYRKYLKQYKRMYRYRYTTGYKIVDYGNGEQRIAIRKPIMTVRFKKGKGYHPFIITKLPMFRSIMYSEEREVHRKEGKQYGSFVPINQSLGEFGSEILPVKVFKHFFDKASHIVFLTNCACRVHGDCQDHIREIGCMHLGDGTYDIKITPDRGKVITSEEALEILKTAIEDGLIPLLGRASGEPMGFGVEDKGNFMSMCFCCPCCCVDAKILTHGSVGIVDNAIFKRMKGVTTEVDEELCTGCEACLEACKFRGMEMHDGIAIVNQRRCLGCGRCESVCPNEAISITIDDDSRVNELIDKLESVVEVENQESEVTSG